jgi:hypothetical protein
MFTLEEIKLRIQAPTPLFFQKLKKTGFLVAAVGTAVLTAPGSIPELVTVWAQHALTAGTVLMTVSQLVVEEGYDQIRA